MHITSDNDVEGIYCCFAEKTEIEKNAPADVVLIDGIYVAVTVADNPHTKTINQSVIKCINTQFNFYKFPNWYLSTSVSCPNINNLFGACLFVIFISHSHSILPLRISRAVTRVSTMYICTVSNAICFVISLSLSFSFSVHLRSKCNKSTEKSISRTHRLQALEFTHPNRTHSFPFRFFILVAHGNAFTSEYYLFSDDDRLVWNLYINSYVVCVWCARPVRVYLSV